MRLEDQYDIQYLCTDEYSVYKNIKYQKIILLVNLKLVWLKVRIRLLEDVLQDSIEELVDTVKQQK